MSLSWKSNFASTEFRIFRGRVIAGLLKATTWKNEAYGELDGNLLRFKTKGFFQKNTEIRDIEGARLLGSIQFHYFRRSATITYNDLEYHWQFLPWSARKWQVKKGEDYAVFKQTGFWQKTGEIDNEGIPAPIVLVSLYVHIHYRKLSAAA
jgi:hypothetical protein